MNDDVKEIKEELKSKMQKCITKNNHISKRPISLTFDFLKGGSLLMCIDKVEEAEQLKQRVKELEETLYKLTELVDNEVDVNMLDLEYEDFKKPYNEILDKAGWSILKIL